MTDIEKYKSVAIKIEAYQKLNPWQSRKVHVDGIIYSLFNRQRSKRNNKQ